MINYRHLIANKTIPISIESLWKLIFKIIMHFKPFNRECYIILKEFKLKTVQYYKKY